MKFSIVFKTVQATGERSSVFIKLNPKTAKMLGKDVIVCRDANIYWHPQWFWLFQPDHSPALIQHIRSQIKSYVSSYLQHSSNLHRRKDKRLAVQNYVDEIGVIISYSVSFHSDFVRQKTALSDRKWLASFQEPQFISKRVHDYNKLSLTELYIINTMISRTDNIDRSTYLTCAELSRMTKVSPETLKRSLSSPLLTPFIQIKKVDGCKTQTLEFTDKGKVEFLNTSLLSVHEESGTETLGEQRQNRYPLNEYTYHTHLALIKRLTDEYKKILNSNTPIIELQKEACLALCLMDSA